MRSGKTSLGEIISKRDSVAQ